MIIYDIWAFFAIVVYNVGGKRWLWRLRKIVNSKVSYRQSTCLTRIKHEINTKFLRKNIVNKG